MAKIYTNELEINASGAVQQLTRVEDRLNEIDAKVQKIRIGDGFARGAVDIQTGEQALRGYIREQRLQDRVIRESTQTIFNMAAAFSFLAGSGGGSLGKLQKGLLTGAAAANSMEFALFSLGQAGAKMGGTMGTLLVRLSALGGPIALAVGLGAGLLAFFSDADKEASKAADGGLKKFEERVKRLAPSDQRAEIRILEAAKQRLSARIAKTTTLLGTGFAEERREELELRKKLLTEELAKLQTNLDLRVDILKATEEEQEYVRREGGTLQIKEQEISLLKQELEAFRGSAAERQQLIDKIAGAEKALSDMRKTTADRDKEAQEALNKASAEWAVQLEERVEQMRELEALLQELDIVLPDVPLDEIAKARAELIDDDIDRIRAQHAAERAVIQQQIEEAGRKGEDTQLLQLKLAKLRKDEEKEIADIQQRNLDQVTDRWERLLDILAQSFSHSGDDFLRKLVTALQIAVQIAKTLQAINAKKEGGDFLDTLTVFAQIAGLLGGFSAKQAPSGQASAPVSPAREVLTGLQFRRSLRPQIAEAAARAGGVQASGADLSALVREVRLLRSELATKDFSPVFTGTMDGQTFLRKNMPRHREFESKKNID